MKELDLSLQAVNQVDNLQDQVMGQVTRKTLLFSQMQTSKKMYIKIIHLGLSSFMLHG